MKDTQTINDKEEIARILHREWIVDNTLQINAFALRCGETYLSVNRKSIKTFLDDIRDFVGSHPCYAVFDNASACRIASMNTGEVRDIRVVLGEKTMDVSVEVEPRNKNCLSHAGIFTRYEGKNVKGGQLVDFETDNGIHVPSSAILQKVQHHLLRLAKLETLAL